MKWWACLAAAIVLAADEKPVVTEVTLLGAPATFPLETRPGQSVDAAKVGRDVKALWEARRPSDVRVEEFLDGGGARVVFRVEPWHTIMLRKIQIDPPTAGIQVGVQPGQEIDAEAPRRIAIELRKQLEHSGYSQATVNARLTAAGAAKADLLIHMEKGRATDVGAVTFSGNIGVKERELRSALRATRARTILPGLWHVLPGYNEDSAPADEVNLRSFYYKRGYVDAVVRAEPVEFDGSKARVRFAVEAGPRSETAEFMDAACRELLRERRKAERRGVLDFSARIEVDEARGTRLAIEPGPAYQIGGITFRGNHKFSENVLRGSLLVDEGAPLDQMRLRRSLARLNATGLFEPLGERDVVVNTPREGGRADVTIWLKEVRARSWRFSGPVGPMSVAGPLEFSLSSRLPPWGKGILDLSTYVASARLMLFAKPIGSLIPFLPNKRFVPLLTLSRPALPGQRFLSGATFVPQLGWKGMLFGYAASQTRDLTQGLFQSERALTPVLPVTIGHGATGGTMYCEAPKTAFDWMRQAGAMVFNVGFSFLPF